MTIKARNNVIGVGLIGMIALYGICLYFGRAFLLDPQRLSIVTFNSEQRWLWLRWQYHPDLLPWHIGGIIAQGIYAVTTQTIMLYLFRRIATPPMRFFAVFVFAAGLHVIRVLQFPIVQAGLPPTFGLLVTRVVLFAYLMGRMSLLLSALYLSDFSHRRAGSALGIIGLIAIVLAYSLPVDVLELEPNIMHAIGGIVDVQITTNIITLLIALTLVHAIITGRSPQICLALLGLVCIAVGWELWFYLGGIATVIVGGVLNVAGTILCASQVYSLYLWE